MKKQQGYLLILAIALIITVAFVSAVLIQLHVRSVSAGGDVAQSAQALNIATSGLQIAKRDIIVHGVTCAGINGQAKYTNASLFNGQFTVTGAASTSASTLSSTISATATSIPLASASGFTSSGVALIDNELIEYAGISGNTLQNAVRGVAGTVAASHASGANVNQNQCTLNSTGAVPSTANPIGQRVIQEVLVGAALSLGGGLGTLPHVVTPGVVSASMVVLQGNAKIINPSVTFSSSNFIGSTIVSACCAVLQGNAKTYINSGNGLVVSSNQWYYNQDIYPWVSEIRSSNLFGYYFDETKTAVQQGAEQHQPGANLNGIKGKTLWINGSTAIQSNTTVGSPTEPVILIVNGSLAMQGNAKVYGFVYTMGSLAIQGNADLYGSAASESVVVLQGKASLTFDNSILSILNLMNSQTTYNYLDDPVTSQEIFS